MPARLFAHAQWDYFASAVQRGGGFMPVYIFRARFVVISVVTAISMLGGIALVFRLGTRSGLERLHTYEIMAMLALLFLPLLTLWAFYADIRSARAAAARESGAAARAGIDPDEDGQRPVQVWGTAAGFGVDGASAVRHERPGDGDSAPDRHRHRTKREISERTPAGL